MTYLKKLLIRIGLLTFIFLFFISFGKTEPLLTHQPFGKLMANQLDTPFPSPPETNPHPPVTSMDKQRVKFAEEALVSLLQKPISPLLKFTPIERALPFQNKDLNCIKNKKCLAKDISFSNELVNFHHQHGEIAEFKHTHLIPWSMEKFNTKSKSDSSSFQNANRVLSLRCRSLFYRRTNI